MSARDPRGHGASQRPEGSPVVSPLMVPMLLLGIVVGFAAGYFLAWWGLIVVGAVLLGAASTVLRGWDRDPATGAVVGVVLGYVGILLVALFRGVL